VPNSYQQTLQMIRGKRQYVARAVNAIMEATDADASVLKDISWSNLLSMPTWCLLDQARIKNLQTACGAVYLQPLVKSSVDGAILKQFRESVGDNLFNFLFELGDSVQAEAISTVTLTSDESLDDTIQSVGASVLLGTLSDMNIVKVYMPVLGKPMLVLDNDQSMQAYKLACQALQLGAPSAPTPRKTQEPSASLSEASSQ